MPARRAAKPAVDNKELPVRPFASAAALEKWLEKNHAKSRGVWIRFAKVKSGLRSVTYPEAVELALMYGWIDGQRKTDTADTFIQKFTPRARRSVWSNINRGKVDALIATGRMRPAGMAEVERAKSDGRWAAAYHSPRTITVPPELEAALKKNRAAGEFFKTLSSANRYAILWRLHTAKKPETRAKRLEMFLAMLEKGETLH